MQKITSRQNENFKIWAQCLESKGVQTHHRAILAGKKITEETLKRHSDKIIAALVPEKLTEKAKERDYILSQDLFDQLDVAGTHQPLLVVNVPEFLPWSDDVKLKGCFLYLSLQDPRNMGAALRSAAAFGVQNIIIGAGSVHPFHPQSTRAASGCVFDHRYFKASGDMESALKKFPTVALDMSGESLHKFKFPKDFILVPGMEGPGIEKGFSPHYRVNIAISENVESLNATTATAIALFEWSKQK